MSARYITKGTVLTITNLNPGDKARERHRKGSNELLEPPFPQAAREFVEKTVDQMRETYERSNRTLEAAVQTLAKSFDVAVQGAAAQRRTIIDFAQKNLNLGFDLAKSLAGASSLFEIVELQAAYWWKQFDVFAPKAEEVRDATKPKAVETSPESIQHEPAKETPPPAQEAPKKWNSPVARDPIAERRLRDTQEFEASPAAGGAAVEPKRMQILSARVSAAEGGTQKPQGRPFSGAVAPRGVRPPDEKQSGSQKKDAAQEEALQQMLPAEINFGILDGYAVRFTSFEAWWLVDGVWRPISPDEVLLNAAVMREARFNKFFPELPRLPSNAFNADKSKN